VDVHKYQIPSGAGIDIWDVFDRKWIGLYLRSTFLPPAGLQMQSLEELHKDSQKEQTGETAPKVASAALDEGEGAKEALPSISSKLQPRDQTGDIKNLEVQMLHARLQDGDSGKYSDDPTRHADMTDEEIDDPRFPYQEWYKTALKAKNAERRQKRRDAKSLKRKAAEQHMEHVPGVKEFLQEQDDEIAAEERDRKRHLSPRERDGA